MVKMTNDLHFIRRKRQILILGIFTIASVSVFFLLNQYEIVQYGQNLHTLDTLKLESVKKQNGSELKLVAKKFVSCYKRPSQENSFPKFECKCYLFYLLIFIFKLTFEQLTKN